MIAAALEAEVQQYVASCVEDGPSADLHGVRTADVDHGGDRDAQDQAVAADVVLG
jgi:hypothetical protein